MKDAIETLGTWGMATSIRDFWSFIPDTGYCGTKTWTNTPGGSVGIFAMFANLRLSFGSVAADPNGYLRLLTRCFEERLGFAVSWAMVGIGTTHGLIAQILIGP